MATIRKRGKKWQVQVRRSGASASKSFHVLKDAKTWARQMEVQADRSELPSDRKVLQQVTLGDLVKRYRDTVSIKKRGHSVERVVLNSFLVHPICRRKLSELGGEHFAAYRDERLRAIKPTTLKRQLGPIRHLFQIARNEWGLPLSQNPLERVAIDAPDQRRERRLRDNEFERLIDSARHCRNPLIAPIIQLALETGMRRSEILSIRKRNVDVKNRSLLLADTKNGQSRTIPLTSKAIALLHGDGGDEDQLFPISANAFRLAWERLRGRAGITDLHFHDLRHEAISRFFEAGLTTPEVASISGHRDMRMLFRYAHASREEVLAKLDSRNLAEIGKQS